MKPKIPTPGTPEGTQIEFKRAEKLRNRDRRLDIVRTVVAMRNADGGTVWVGLAEKGEKLERQDPLGESDKPLIEDLRNQLIDLIEPMPRLETDVLLHSVEVEGGWVLGLEVKSLKGPPSCMTKGRRREFLTRSGSRNKPLSYAEIVAPGKESPSLRAEVDRQHELWSQEFDPTAGLAVSALPEGSPDEAPTKVAPSVKALLTSPPPSVARESGWTWHSRYAKPGSNRGSIRAGQGDYRMLEVSPVGRVQFFTALEHLVWKENADATGVEFEQPLKGQLYPYAVVETVASLMRVIRAVFDELDLPERLTVGLVLSIERGAGWVMCRKPPDRWFFEGLIREEWFQVPENPTRTSVHLQTVERVRSDPDAISHALLLELLESDGETQRSLPWFEGGPDRPVFTPPT